MSRYQLFNGQFYPADEKLLSVSNRGFRYGDGFFESMRMSNGSVPLIKGHWQRLLRATDFLQIRIPQNLNEKTFGQYASELCKQNSLENARLRFHGFRLGEGRYAPEESLLGWSLVCEPAEFPEYRLNRNGLHVEVCTTHSINPAPQSSFKSSNSLPYVMGGVFVQKNGLDDCFLLDANGYLAEATGSNIFLLKGNELITPDLRNGGVPGVMRSVVISQAKQLGLKVTERLVEVKELNDADECFLTNAARGPQWVAAVGKKRYFKRFASKLTDEINRTYRLI
ncbi:MAG: hypothetical protein GC178_02135 [Flavobacteriales bacterium]|nr:hypothetical protein [Flavobacteriales bacterium]